MTQPAHLEGLNPEQEEAVRSLEGPLLILAGAGSGKTRVLTRRVAHLLHEGVRPWEILAVTFTNKAAREMRDRIASLVGEAAADLRVGTFHATCARILRYDIEPLGYTRSFVIYDDDDQRRLLKDILRELNVDTDRLKPRAARSFIDRWKSRLLSPARASERHEPEVPTAALRVYERYEERLRQANALDFNDLINRSVELFRRHPPALHRWQRRARYLLVDEYQDTNLAQYLLVRQLGAASRNVAVVGDDDQSIYSFRGADIRNILSFEHDFPEAKVIRLEQNYRSTGHILRAATAVVSNNRRRKVKVLRTDAPDGEKIRQIVGRDEESEARKVAEEILSLRRQGVRPSDIAIIYRTNARSRVFEQALVATRQPHLLVGARRFYERREVRDLLGYLRLVVNPADEMGLLRVINVPRRGIGARTVEKLMDLAERRGVQPLDAARIMARAGGRAGKALGRFVELIDRFSEEATQRSPGELVQFIAEETGYLPQLRAEDSEEARDRIRNIEELCRDVEGELEDPPEDPMQRLQEFLDRSSLAGQDEDLDAAGGRITLMTAHLSKGLEFPVVFVAGLTEGSFPMLFDSYSEDDLEEERRLMYVAITRAQRRLYLTRAMRRRVYGRGGAGYMDADRSRFLTEIPRELIHGSRSARRRARPSPALPSQSAARLDAFLAQHGQATSPAESPGTSPGTRTTRAPSDPEDFRVAGLVSHEQFGEGRILRKRRLPGTVLLTVDFGTRGRRTINPRWESLEIIVED